MPFFLPSSKTVHRTICIQTAQQVKVNSILSIAYFSFIALFLSRVLFPATFRKHPKLQQYCGCGVYSISLHFLQVFNPNFCIFFLFVSLYNVVGVFCLFVCWFFFPHSLFLFCVFMFVWFGLYYFAK